MEPLKKAEQTSKQKVVGMCEYLGFDDSCVALLKKLGTQGIADSKKVDLLSDGLTKLFETLL